MALPSVAPDAGDRRLSRSTRDSLTRRACPAGACVLLYVGHEVREHTLGSGSQFYGAASSRARLMDCVRNEKAADGIHISGLLSLDLRPKEKLSSHGYCEHVEKSGMRACRQAESLR